MKVSRNILNLKGPIRILKVQLTDLHRIAPRIAPCAWDSRDSVKHGLILLKIAFKMVGIKNKKILMRGQGGKKKTFKYKEMSVKGSLGIFKAQIVCS